MLSDYAFFLSFGNTHPFWHMHKQTARILGHEMKAFSTSVLHKLVCITEFDESVAETTSCDAEYFMVKTRGTFWKKNYMLC